jgi:hypothetical protein
MHNFTLPENAKVFGALKPATDAAGRTGRYFNWRSPTRRTSSSRSTRATPRRSRCDLLQATSAAGAGARC